MMDITSATVTQLSAALHSGRCSSIELTREYLQRIQQKNPNLNAFISIHEESAFEQATASDVAFAKGRAGPLNGIPIAYKDLFCTKGQRTTCASLMLDNFIAPYNATVVEKLTRAGMVNIGKTNMDQFAMGSTNENSYYGACKHPVHDNCVPGGSSGGSAAAVADSLVPVAIGTDTGGSIRQPAALCGITGIKPTYGRVSRYGMIAYGSSLDQAGPLAATAEDCALLLEAMAGFDSHDSTSVNQPVKSYRTALNRDVHGLKLGLPREFLGDGLAETVRNQLDAVLARYSKLGIEIVDVSLNHFPYAVACYYIIAMAEASSNLARFDGVRYGYRCSKPQNIHDLYTRSRSEGLSEEVKRRIIVGSYVLSAGYYDAYYLKAQRVRRLIANDFQQVFRHVDAVIGPVTPYLNWTTGQKHDPVTMYLGDLYTVPANLAGLPALSHPSYAGKQSIGVQLIGKHWDEATLFALAHQYQLVYNHAKTQDL